MKKVEINGKQLTLSIPEYNLFMFLYAQHGKITTSKEINDALFHHKTFNKSVLKHIQKLQKSIGSDTVSIPSPNNYKLIVTNLNTAI